MCWRSCFVVSSWPGCLDSATGTGIRPMALLLVLERLLQTLWLPQFLLPVLEPGPQDWWPERRRERLLVQSQRQQQLQSRGQLVRLACAGLL